MKKLTKILIFTIFLVSFLGVITYADIIPTDDWDFKNFYELLNVAYLTADNATIENITATNLTTHNLTIYSIEGCTEALETTAEGVVYCGTDANEASKSGAGPGLSNDTDKIYLNDTHTNQTNYVAGIINDWNSTANTTYDTYVIANHSNTSTYWDNLDTINSTQMEDQGGILNILESWLFTLFYKKEEVYSTTQVYNKTEVYPIDHVYNKTETNITIDQKIASVTYNATSIETTAGTNDTGNVSSIHISGDGFTYNISESGGTPALIVIINFTGVTDYNSIIMREWYMAGAGHHLHVGLYDYDSRIWEEAYGEITDMNAYAFKIFNVLDASNHISSGEVSVRIRHEQSGNPAHDFSLDYLVLVEGVSTSVTSEHDALSGRTNIVNHPWALPTDGSRNATFILASILHALDYTNVTITESQITDLSHNVDTGVFVNCTGINIGLGNGTCVAGHFFDTNITGAGSVFDPMHFYFVNQTRNNTEVYTTTQAPNFTELNQTILANITNIHCANITGDDGDDTDFCADADTGGGGAGGGFPVWVNDTANLIAFLNSSMAENVNITKDLLVGRNMTVTDSINTSAYYLNDVYKWIKPEHIEDVDKENIEGDVNTFVDVTSDNMTGLLIAGGVNTSYLNISLNEIFFGTTDADHFLYFYEGNSKGEYLKWDDGDDRFEFSDVLYVPASIINTGNIQSGADIYTTSTGDDSWLGSSSQATAPYQAYANGSLYIRTLSAPDGEGISLGQSIIPDINSTYSLGNKSLFFKDAYFNESITIIENETEGEIFVYGDGTAITLPRYIGVKTRVIYAFNIQGLPTVGLGFDFSNNRIVMADNVGIQNFYFTLIGDKGKFFARPITTAPGSCEIGQFYVDTSGAYCGCSINGTWDELNNGGAGSCA